MSRRRSVSPSPSASPSGVRFHDAIHDDGPAEEEASTMLHPVRLRLDTAAPTEMERDAATPPATPPARSPSVPLMLMRGTSASQRIISATPHAAMRFVTVGDEAAAPVPLSPLSSAKENESANALTWPRTVPSALVTPLQPVARRFVPGAVDPFNAMYMPLPITNLPQSTVHLTWRMASQNIDLRLQATERTHRAVQSTVHSAHRGGRPQSVELASLFLTPESAEATKRLVFDEDDEKDASGSPSVPSTPRKVKSQQPHHPPSIAPIAEQPQILSPRKGKSSGPREALDADWHRLTLGEIEEQLDCSVTNGLSEAGLPARRLRFGCNVLTTTGNKYWRLVVMFAKQLVAGFGLILWIAALLAFLAWHPLGQPSDPTNLYLAIVLVMVVVLQAIFNFYQEYSSNAIMDSFRSLIPSVAIVMRRVRVPNPAGGADIETCVEREVDATELLVGDLVKIAMGQKVPADIRIIEVAELRVNNSALTGEMEAVTCTAHATSPNFLESSNCVFFGSMAVEGSALGVVVAVGDNTVLGKISRLSSEESPEPLGLHQEIGRFVNFIVIAACTTAAISFIGWGVWLDKSYPKFLPLSSMIVNVIGLVVAYVPTGLPVSVTLALTMVAKRMARQQVLVKNLATVETFNSVTVIATDKTGTLTQNKMSVANILWGHTSAITSTAASRGIGIHAKDTRDAPEFAPYRVLIQGAQLCNAATLRVVTEAVEASPSETELNVAIAAHLREMRDLAASATSGVLKGEQALLAVLAGSERANACFVDVQQQCNPDSDSQSTYTIVGDAADTAYYGFTCALLGLNVEMTRAMYERVKVLPFNSKNKFMIAICHSWQQVSKRMKKELDAAAKTAADVPVPTEATVAVKSVKLDAPANPVAASPSSLYPALPRAASAPPHVVWMKGACEIVLTRCSTFLSDFGEEEPLTPGVLAHFLERLESLGRLGERVLGFAKKDMDYDAWLDQQKGHADEEKPSSDDPTKNDPRGFPCRGLCFVGMISLSQKRTQTSDGGVESGPRWILTMFLHSLLFCLPVVDPPRPGVAAAVLKCRRAGIMVAMVTGDMPSTAKSIAQKVNILSRQSAYEIGCMPVHELFTTERRPSLTSQRSVGRDNKHAGGDIPQDSLEVIEDDEGCCSVVLKRDGIEIARHVPVLTAEEQDMADVETLDADADPSASPPQPSVQDLEAGTVQPQTSELVRETPAALRKRLGKARSTLKDVVQAPVQPPSRMPVPVGGVANGAVNDAATSNGVHSVTTGLFGPEVTGVGCTQSDSFSSAAPLPYSLVLTGSQLKVLDDALWDWIMRHTEGVVFARTSPEQKLRIVIEYQKRGHIVAVTGDGVNDAPALKRANLGVAMQAGAEVAREASDLILLDNNFGSIVTAIEMGRTVFDNLKKVTLYLLPAGSWSEMLPIIANVFLGMPLPLSPFLMIVICILTDLFPSLALVNEQAEDNIMGRKPRDVTNDHLVNGRLLFFAYINIGMIESVSAFLLFFAYLSDQGIPASAVWLAYDDWEEGYYGFTQHELNELQYTGQSIFFLSLVITQFGNLLSTRTRLMSFFAQNPLYGPRRNLHILFAIVVSTLIAVLFTQVRFFNDAFNTRPVPAKYIAPAIGFAAVIFVYDEMRKYVVRNYPDSWVAKIAW